MIVDKNANLTELAADSGGACVHDRNPVANAGRDAWGGDLGPCTCARYYRKPANIIQLF